MTEINEQEVKSPLDILSQLEKERTDACLMIGESKIIMELCSEYTAYKRAEDGMEWFLLFSNLRRSADMIEQSLSRMEELNIDCEQKLKEVQGMKIQVRCEKCNKLLGNFENGQGEIKCPRCSHKQKIKL